MSARNIIILLVVLIAAASLGGWYALNHVHRDDSVLRVSGNIEAVTVDISFKIAGRVEKRLVDEGDRVRREQLLAELDTADLKAEVKLREAELKAAEAASAELEAGSRPEEKQAAEAALLKAQALLAELKAGSRSQEIKAAEAQLAAAKTERDRLKTEWARAHQLYASRSISAEQRDQAEAAWKVAEDRYRQAVQQESLVKEGPRKEQIEQAEAAVKQAEAQRTLVEKGPREETKAQAAARVQQAQAALALARTKLGYAQVFSPLDGVVLSKNKEPGEYVAPGVPVVTVADVKNVWLRAYVNYVDLDRIRLDQPVEVTTDTRAGKVYPGRISFISQEAEFTPKNVQTEKERVKLVYRIKIDIDNAREELKPGMPADAKISWTLSAPSN